MEKKGKRKQFLACFLAVVMILCSVSTLSAIVKADQQKTDAPYPYTIFAASKKEGSITIDANNFCVNGNVATNGTLSATGNVSINGEKLENIDKEMIYIFDAIDDAYFSGTGYEEYEEDYSISEQNININTPVEVKGEMSLEGNINLTTAIKTFEDIILNGEVKNTENSILFSKYGDIIIESTNVNLNGLVYAPFGCVSITAQNLTLNNIIIIAQEVKITCGSVNANYSSRMAQFVGNESEELHIPEDEQKYLDGKDIPGTSNPDVSDTEDDSSEEGDSEENSSEESDSEEEDGDDNYGDEDAFWDLLSRYDEWEDMEDTDGDGLPDEVEEVIGSRIDMRDTDEDGLDDYYELMVLGTSPTEKDTDGNGINDPDEDFDEDGLSNYEEYLLDTYPWEPDTDEDNLSDWDEVYVYGTDPRVQDSDEDGLFDGDEVALGTEPLNPDSDGNGILDGDETYEQAYVYEVENADECAVSQVIIEMEATGNLASTTTIESIMGIDVVCSEVVGLFGEPFEIETTSQFETAKLTFVVDPSKLGDTALSDLLFLWYDEENGQFVELETTYDEETGAVSTETTHFSSYLLVNSTEWFEAWAKELDYSSMEDDKEGVDYVNGSFIHVAIDLSSPKNMDRGFVPDEEADLEMIKKSLKANPPYDPMAISISEALIGNMKTDDVMSMSFFTTRRQLITADVPCEVKEFLYDQLDEIDDECLIAAHSYISGKTQYQDDSYIDGYSNYNDAISCCANYGYEHKNYLYGTYLYIISSGKGKIEDIETYRLNFARVNNIHINTIAIGEYADVVTLQYIADFTGGKCYVISDEDDLEELYEDILSEKSIFDSTDTDGDGIPDIMEIRGMRNQWGEIVYTDPTLDDSDGDGLKDGEEIDIQNLRKKYITGWDFLEESYYYYMYSHPRRPDTDGDGYMDEDEIKIYGSNPWHPDVRTYQLSQDYIQVAYTGKAEWDNFGSQISYGGAQKWFKPYPDTWSQTLADYGCGLISAADILLYMTKTGAIKNTNITNVIKYNEENHIVDDTYIKYIYRMDFLYFHTPTFTKGLLGTSIANKIEDYSDRYELGISAKWCFSKSKILPRIEEMITNDIPVTLSIGPAGSNNDGLVILFRKENYGTNIFTSTGIGTESHYVTVTGVIVDDIKEQTWLKISNRGKEYYINYDQYLGFMHRYSSRLFSNIVYINR